MKRIFAIHFLVCGFLGLLANGTTTKAAELINMTNSVWSYQSDTNDLAGTFWNEIDYAEAATWPTGRALFGVESTAYPFPFVTPWLPPADGGAMTEYLRHTFIWDGSVTDNPFIVATIHVDDGYVMYLNGVEIDRYNMPEGDVNWATGALSANPLGEPVTYKLLLQASDLATPLMIGENLLAVELHQAGGSNDKVWGMQADVVSGAAPVVTSPTADQTIFVVQGTSRDLTIEATGLPSPGYQWEFSTDAGASFATLDGETSATYTIGFMTATNVGLYRCVASSVLGSVNSPIFDVRVQEDVIAPSITSVITEGNDLVRITFSEDVIINANAFLYYVLGSDASIRSTGLGGLNSSANTLEMSVLSDANLGTPLPLDQGVDYQVVIFQAEPPAVTDLFGNPLPPNVDVDPVFGQIPATVYDVSPMIRFQEGIDGYTGTQDTEIRFSNPTADLGQAASINVDVADAGGEVHGLMRFDNLIGSSGVPFGATIIEATLSIWTSDPGTPVNLHRMLINWDESSNWNTFGGDGIQADDIEAVATMDAQIITESAGVFHTADVTASVQAWADGTGQNYGWALLPTGGNGWDFDTSEAATDSQRPSLVVFFDEPICEAPPEFIRQPQSSNPSYEEGETVSLSVIARCVETYQWRREGEEIPGANESTFSVLFVGPVDGHYDVIVSNEFGSVTSESINVCCRGHGEPPELVDYFANGTAGTVTLSFDELLATGPAEDLSNYTLGIIGGGTAAVTGAALQPNGTDVVLSASLNANERYILTITNLSDTAGFPNVIWPIVIDPLVVSYTILEWDAEWAYTTNPADAPVPGWEATAFDEANWLIGPGLFGWETSAGTPIPNPPGIQTPFSLTNELGDWQWTFYFRKTIDNTITPAADVVFNFRHLIDDGAIFYVGGAEAARFNMSITNSPAPVAYTNAADGTGEAALTDTEVALALGSNDIAVEVHQGNVGSSDVLFGMQIVAVVGEAPLVKANLRITLQYGGFMYVEWDDPSLVLLAAPAPEGPYTEVVGASSPYILFKPLAANMQFFSLGKAL